MEIQKLSWPDRAYHALLRLFPSDFRGEFESEMEQAFREQRRRVESRQGVLGVLRLWGETIAGIFRVAPREHLAMLSQDLRYAFRMLGQNPGYAAVSVLTLALGLGVNTAIVSVIDAVLLRPLPYSNDGQLMVLHQREEKAGAADMGFSVPEIEDYRRQSAAFASLVEYHNMRFTLFSKTEATRVQAGVVSPGFFGMFGVKPILGRDFVAADDLPGAPAVLLLSNEYWKQHFGGDPKIVGRVFEMNDRVHTVIGVLPPVPQYPQENDVYMPTSACPFRSAPGMIRNRAGRMMSLFGRLKPGVTAEQSRADLKLIASRFERDHSDSYNQAGGFTSTSGLLREELTRRARTTLWVLLAAAGCVLLIACANVANLTLARMSARERELNVRAALGAGKGRLLRQLATESLLVGLLAAGLGVVLASASLRLLTEFTAKLTPRAREIHLDFTMLLFALGIAIATSMIFGTVAALYSRTDLTDGLKDGATQTTAGHGRSRARSVLVVCQIAFSLVLLIGAGLMLRSLDKLQRVDPGFVPNRVLAMTVDLNWSKYQGKTPVREVSARLLRKIESQPGVLSAAISSGFPLDPDNAMGTAASAQFMIEGRPARDGEAPSRANFRSGTPDYFRTLGIRLIEGRTFAVSDRDKSPLVVVINQSFAGHYWKNEDPVGKRVSFDRGDTWYKIVGIVGDVREFGLTQPASDEAYFANAQEPALGSVLVRTDRDPMVLAPQLRRAVLDVDPQIAIPNVETLEQARHDVVASPRVLADLLGIFAALALVIAAAGIGGMLALVVNQRRNEIGIRVALGARPVQVFAMVLKQGMTLVAIGLGAGLLAALALTRLMKTLLFEVQPTDPATFAGVSIILASVAFVACYLPSRQALGVDPLAALRRE
jgi:putative ABC transport system permease protein